MSERCENLWTPDSEIGDPVSERNANAFTGHHSVWQTSQGSRVALQELLNLDMKTDLLQQKASTGSHFPKSGSSFSQKHAQRIMGDMRRGQAERGMAVTCAEDRRRRGMAVTCAEGYGGEPWVGGLSRTRALGKEACNKTPEKPGCLCLARGLPTLPS